MVHTKILVVEDEVDAAQALCAFLGRRGYDVAMTGNGAQALELIATAVPDLVLLDITLQGMDGLGVLRALRAQGVTPRVIMMTGQFLAPKIEAEVIALGVSEYLQKPVVLSRLDAAVVRALGGREAVFTSRPSFSGEVEDSARSRFHKVANILGVIRVQCENYVLDVEDGVKPKTSSRGRQAEALDIMKDVMSRVDQLAVEIEILRRR